MQINNNVQTTNFGQLKVAKNARPYLEALKPNELAILNKAGETMKNTKFYDIDVFVAEKKLKCEISSLRDVFFDKFEGNVLSANEYGVSYYKGQPHECKSILLLQKDGLDTYGIAQKNTYSPNMSDLSRISYNVWSRWDGASNFAPDMSHVKRVDELATIATELDAKAVEQAKTVSDNKKLAEKEQQTSKNLTNSLLEKFGV